MAQSVWVLSVDLQTKTATFQSGLGDAARKAKDSFDDIKRNAQTMGNDTSYSMGEARHSVMLLGEEFGLHLPRGITSFIASLGPVGAALEAAFPFLAIAVGATLLIEHLTKLAEEADKAANAQVQFGTTVTKSFMELDDKLLRAGIQMDELTGDHLGALQKELELIDHATLKDLMAELDTIAKAADSTFSTLKTSWYQFSEGSRGAQHALEDFKLQYDSLMSQGKDKQAHGLLVGTLDAAKKKLADEQQSRAAVGMGGFDQKQIDAQNILIGALNAQITAEQKLAALKQAQDNVAEAKTDKVIGGEDDKKWRELGRQAKQEADDAERAWDAAYKDAVSKLQESEKEKIAATKQGSAQRLAAIDAAIKEEQAKGLQDTGYYKSLLTEKVNVTRQMGEEQARVEAEVGKEMAANDLRMGQLSIAAEQEYYNHRAAMRHVSDAVRLAEAMRIEQEEYELQRQAFEAEIAALDKNDKTYEAKLKQLQDRELQLRQEHENKITTMEDKAEQERHARILSGEHQFQSTIAQGLTTSLMQHKNFGDQMASIGNQIASGMLQNALKAIMANDMTKPSDAAFAARQGWKAGSKFPFPVDLVMAPALAAAAFASVMAFNEGGIVPGAGNSDSVHAMLTPGEGVIPKKLMDGLRSVAEHGNMSKDQPTGHAPAPHITMHIQTPDANSFKHSQSQLHSKAFHAANTASKRNR